MFLHISSSVLQTQAASKAGGGKTSSRSKRPAPPTRVRLAKKLLSAKGQSQALGELMHVEGERQRELDSQKW